jgi:manganese transport protein
MGPAFVAAVAYVDPGNFATNVAAGSQHGYLLVWVVLASNLIAMLIQYLSAKLGIATGKSLAALCREHYPTPVARLLWVQAELVAVATDLAEVVGGAIALQLLFGLPLLTGGLVTGVVAFAMLGLRRGGHRPFERAVTGLLAVILVGFTVDAVRAGIHPPAILRGAVPQLAGQDSLLLAVGMLGATVMPHAIYLHGGLTSGRRDGAGADPATVMRAQRIDVVAAMSMAGLMNLLLLVLAAAALSGRGISTIESAHATLGTTLGAAPALLFALALLASGLAASSVGTLAGQLVMEGFVRRRIPLAARRLAALVPPMIVLAMHVDPTRALVVSQVVLSFGIPFALTPLVHLTAHRKLMGVFVNRRLTTLAGALCAAVVIALNGVLLATLG